LWYHAFDSSHVFRSVSASSRGTLLLWHQPSIASSDRKSRMFAQVKTRSSYQRLSGNGKWTRPASPCNSPPSTERRTGESSSAYSVSSSASQPPSTQTPSPADDCSAVGGSPCSTRRTYTNERTSQSSWSSSCGPSTYPPYSTFRPRLARLAYRATSR
jgi:hypothetical protein